MPPRINVGPLTGLPWIQRGISYGRNSSGPFQVWITEGLDADVDADAGWFHAEGWEYTVERRGAGISHMQARAGWMSGGGPGTDYTTEVLENIWELDPQETEKALLEADFPNGSTLELFSVRTKEAILAAVANLSSGNPPLWSIAETRLITGGSNSVTYNFDGGITDTTTTVSLPVSDYAPAYSLFKLLAARVTMFPMNASVIQHTQLVSNLYTAQASFSNMGRIISNATMIGIEGMPTGLLFGLPTLPAPEFFIETTGDLQYGWRKSGPGVSRLELSKWRIVQRWQLGLWPVRLYGSVL